MKFPNIERIAVVLLAVGCGFIAFLRVVETGRPVLPLEERKRIVSADRAFLEGAPELAAENRQPVRGLDQPGTRDVDGDKCTGKDCQVNSITTYNNLTVAQLPSCNASARAQTRWAKNGAADGGGTNMECNGSAWVAVGGAGATAGADTCTGPSCAIGAVGISTDGGLIITGSPGGFGIALPTGQYICLDRTGCNTRISDQSGNLDLATTNGSSKLRITGATGRTSTLSFGFDSAADVSVATFFASTGEALTTGAACTAKRFEWDTGNTCWKMCNGTWSACVTTAPLAINNYWSATCFGVCGNDTNFTGGMYALGGTAVRVTCSWGTAGTVGGANGVVIKIRSNQGGGTDLCNCTIGACNIAANTPTSCACNGTLTSGDLTTFRLHGNTDCGGNPSNIICTASVTP